MADVGCACFECGTELWWCSAKDCCLGARCPPGLALPPHPKIPSYEVAKDRQVALAITDLSNLFGTVKFYK